MTINVIFHGYYYRYREKRKQIKSIVDSADYAQAKTDLDAAITEHKNKYGDTNTMRLNKPDFNYGERIAMEHAQRHLNMVIDKNDPSFLYDDGSIGHHSDITKQALTHVPKSDYSEEV